MKKRIVIIPDGPYEVSGNTPLRLVRTTVDSQGASVEWVDGKEYTDMEEPYHLCRCGHSSHKPFCDGSHCAQNFRGHTASSHTIDDTDAKWYDGPTLDLYDNEQLCASMRFCDRGENAWNAAGNSCDEQSRDLAIAEVSCCPSGRLSLKEKDGTPVEPKLPEEIQPIEDTVHDCRGPLWVKGGIALESSDGQEYTIRNRMTLCRCGESKNKPFCDSSHVYCSHMEGFDDDK